MAQLVALHFENGEWDVFVVEGLMRGVLDRKPVQQDVLGRRLPPSIRAEALPIVKPSEQIRIANELKGLSRERRQQFYLSADDRLKISWETNS